MTWRTQWTPRGAVFPRSWTFWAPDAAEWFAEYLRERGHENVTIHQLPDATREKP